MTAKTFHGAAESLRGVFGTENAAALLYALVRFARPRSVLEIGAGLSSLWILKALDENVADDQIERTTDRNIYGKTDWYAAPYAPKLTTLDDLSHRRSLAPLLARIAHDLGLAPLLNLRESDFHGFSHQLPQSALPLDLVWFDCGGLDEYLDFTEEYWPLVNPEGGLIVYHSTLTNIQLRVFLAAVTARQAEKGGFELLSLLEPHKKLQNSVSLIRRTSGAPDPLYTWEP